MRAPKFIGAATLGCALWVTSAWAQDAGGAKPAAPASAATQAKDSKLFGRFTSVATEAEKQVRQKSVEKAISEISFVLRSFGRKRVEAKTHIPSWVEIKQTGPNTVTFHFEGRSPEPCPLSGSTKGKDPDGKEAEFAARWDGASLIQTVTTEDGKRTNVFKPQADGSLKLSVELKSDRFETPIRYTLSYKPA